MKNLKLIALIALTNVFITNAFSQFTAGTPHAVLPKKVCEIPYGTVHAISLTGNKDRDYKLISKSETSSADYKFVIKKTGGKAKATFTIFIDGIQNRQWYFEGDIEIGEKIVNLNNIAGKEVTLLVKNHSATNTINAICRIYKKTNSMLGLSSDETMTRKIEQDFSTRLFMPCNGKGTIEITRLGGTSSAEIEVKLGNTVLETHTMNANQGSKKFNLTGINTNSLNQLTLTVRNIQTGQFLRARIGAWFN